MRFGLVTEIDSWMIENAANAHANYSVPAHSLQFSINLSANAFENDDLVEHIEKCFEEYNVPPQGHIFGITESLAVRHPLHVERQIAALRDMGCRLALDDFGTGYSSFSYRQKLQFDYIKIDGTFVEDIINNPVDQKMIRLIAEIGEEAGMEIVAEYVKSMALLGDLGVDLAQGYLVGRPTPKPEHESTPISLDARRDRSIANV